MKRRLVYDSRNSLIELLINCTKINKIHEKVILTVQYKSKDALESVTTLIRKWKVRVKTLTSDELC